MKCEGTERRCLAPERCEIVGCLRRLGEDAPAPPATAATDEHWLVTANERLEARRAALSAGVRSGVRRVFGLSPLADASAKPLTLPPGTAIEMAPAPREPDGAPPLALPSEDPPVTDTPEPKPLPSNPLALQPNQALLAIGQNQHQAQQALAQAHPQHPIGGLQVAARRPRELRIGTVKSGGFAVLEDGAILAVAMTEDQAGAAVAALLKAG